MGYHMPSGNYCIHNHIYTFYPHIAVTLNKAQSKFTEGMTQDKPFQQFQIMQICENKLKAVIIDFWPAEGSSTSCHRSKTVGCKPKQ